MELRFCKDCKWMVLSDTKSQCCSNIKVNSDNGYYLGAGWAPKGCHEERNLKWFGACGSRGKLWEAK